MGNLGESLPGAPYLPRDQSRGIAVPTVVAGDAYGVGEPRCGQGGAKADGQRFFADPSLAKPRDVADGIDGTPPGKLDGFLNGNHRLAGPSRQRAMSRAWPIAPSMSKPSRTARTITAITPAL